MEALKSSVAMCSNHSSEVAKAVCITTKELLCFSCSLEKAKSTECVKEIEKMSDEADKLFLNCLLAMQNAKRKHDLIVDYKKKTDDVKEKLNAQIQDFYKRLSENLVKMKEHALESLETKETLFLETCKKDEKEVEKTTESINSLIDKLSKVKETEFDNFRREVDGLVKQLDDIPDHESCPDGVFLAKQSWEEMMKKAENSLWEVNLYNNDHYEKPGPLESTKDINKSEPENIEVDEQLPIRPPKPQYVTNESDEISEEKPQIVPRVKPKKKEESRPDTSIQLPTKRTPSQNSLGATESENQKEEKARKRFIFGKKNPETKLQVYEVVVLGSHTPHRAKYLVNKAVSLFEFPKQSDRVPFKFTKLVPLGSGRLGLLSLTHSSIFVAGLDGKIQCAKDYPKDALISIAEMSDDMIAVLKQNESSIEIVNIIDTGFEVKNTLKLTIDISKVTDFEYSKTKSYFAIGTEREFFILDKKGKKSKSKKMETRDDSSEMITLYDFEKSYIFIINKKTKSIKCESLKGTAPLWKRKCEYELFQPKSACLHRELICIASSCAITIFSAKDGEAQMKHETGDLVKDCLGLCVIDNVLAISSNSDDFEESKKLGFLNS